MVAAAGRAAHNDQVAGIELIHLVGFEIELIPIVQSDINIVPFSGKPVYEPLVILDTVEIFVPGCRHPDDIRPGGRLDYVAANYDVVYIDIAICEIVLPRGRLEQNVLKVCRAVA